MTTKYKFTNVYQQRRPYAHSSSPTICGKGSSFGHSCRLLALYRIEELDAGNIKLPLSKTTANTGIVYKQSKATY